MEENTTENIKLLNFSQKQLKDLNNLPQVADNSNITSLDLSSNELETLEGIENFGNVTKLDVQQNQLVSIFPSLSNCSHIHVLNISKNRLSSLEGIETLTELCALIAGENLLTNFPNLSMLEHLTTITMKSNQISTFNPSFLPPNIAKINLSQNPLHTLPDFSDFKTIEELHFNRTELTEIPEFLCSLPNLVFLDLGNNQLSSFEPILKAPILKQLSLRGNNFNLSVDDYKETILTALPKLVTLDSKRVKPKKSHFKPNTPEYEQKQQAKEKALEEQKRERRRQERQEKKQKAHEWREKHPNAKDKIQTKRGGVKVREKKEKLLLSSNVQKQ